MIDSWGQNIYQHVTGNDRKFILISFHQGFCHNLLDTKGREKIRQNGNFVQKYPRGKGPCSIHVAKDHAVLQSWSRAELSFLSWSGAELFGRVTAPTFTKVRRTKKT